MVSLLRHAFAGLGLLALAACASVQFDQDAYQSVVQLKYETLTLVDQSSGRYAASRTSADALLAKYAAASENAAKIPANDVIVQQWAAIRDPRGNSAGALIETWKKGPLRPATRVERKRAIAAHFDRLICLEGAKQKATDCGSAVVVAAPAAAPRARPGAAAPAAEEVEVEMEPVEPPKQQ